MPIKFSRFRLRDRVAYMHYDPSDPDAPPRLRYGTVIGRALGDKPHYDVALDDGPTVKAIPDKDLSRAAVTVEQGETVSLS